MQITTTLRALSILVVFLIGCSLASGYALGHYTTRYDLERAFAKKKALIDQYISNTQEELTNLRLRTNEPCRSQQQSNTLSLLPNITTGTARITFYSENNAGGRRLMKRTAPYGLVAASMKYWKRGTMVIIEGLGAFIINDTGAALEDCKMCFDVFQPDGKIPSVGVMKLRIIVIGR